MVNNQTNQINQANKMKLSDGTAIALLIAGSNWTGVDYTGVAITGTYEGQYYDDGIYHFYAYSDNSWVRLYKGTVSPSYTSGTFTVADTENLVGLTVYQNDITNNPIATRIENTGTGDSLQINTTDFIVDSAGIIGIGVVPLANMAAGDLVLEGGSLVLKEITTPTADPNYGKVYPKADNNLYFQDGAGNEHLISVSSYAECSITGGSLTAIDTIGEIHAWNDAATIVGEISSFLEFHTGQTVAISNYADNGGGLVRVTTDAHTLVTGDYVTVTGTTNYTGIWQITVINATTIDLIGSTFTIAGADVTGALRHGDHFTVLTGGAGTHTILLSISTLKVGGGATTCTIGIYKNTLLDHSIDRSITNAADIGALTMTCLITLSVGDDIWVGISGTSTDDIILSKGNFILSRV